MFNLETNLKPSSFCAVTGELEPPGHAMMRHMWRSVRWIIRHHSATPYVTFYVAVVIQGGNNSDGESEVDLMFSNRHGIIDTNLRTSP